MCVSSPSAEAEPLCVSIFSLPFCDWCPLRVYALSPSVIGARYGYMLSPLLRLVPASVIGPERAISAAPTSAAAARWLRAASSWLPAWRASAASLAASAPAPGRAWRVASASSTRPILSMHVAMRRCARSYPGSSDTCTGWEGSTRGRSCQGRPTRIRSISDDQRGRHRAPTLNYYK
eukprot:4217537-Pyramimonas_sp.AAC.2